MQPEFHGRIENGRFKLNRKPVFELYVKGLKDGRYYLKLHRAKGPPKTQEQLGYYFAGIIPTVYKQMIDDGNSHFVVKVANAFKEVPLTPEIVDYLLKEACAKFDGKVVNKADMSKEQASIFIDNCIRWSARWLSCVIPEPS